MIRSFLVLALLVGRLIASPFAFSEEVIDFESDIIEGDKKAPDFFLQMESDVGEFTPILYDRKDFNDFHRQDLKSRPMLKNQPIQRRR